MKSVASWVASLLLGCVFAAGVIGTVRVLEWLMPVEEIVLPDFYPPHYHDGIDLEH